MALGLTNRHTDAERWLPCPGFEGHYEVSTQGRVRRISRLARPRQTEPRARESPQLLRGTELSSGYTEYTLSLRGQAHKRLAHRLVAEAFLGPPPDGHEVQHKNGRKDDDRVSNLGWVTRSEAVRHRVQVRGVGRGALHGRAKLSEADVRAIRARFDAGESQRGIAADYGVSHTVIGQIGKRTRWAHVE